MDTVQMKLKELYDLDDLPPITVEDLVDPQVHFKPMATTEQLGLLSPQDLARQLNQTVIDSVEPITGEYDYKRVVITI